MATPDTTPAVSADPAAIDALIASVEADLDGERYTAAIARIAGVDLAALDQDRWERVIATALRCRLYGGEPVDKVVLDARRAVARARPGRPRALVHAEIGFALSAKRCSRLARIAAEAATAEWPVGSLGSAQRGWIALQTDHRDEAAAAYTEATTREEPYRGWFGLARVHYITGDFDASLTALAELGDFHRTKVGALRIRADIARVRADWSGFLALVDEILAATPGGDSQRSDLLDRASALFALGQREQGLEVYRALWRDDDADPPGKFARAVLNTVERGDGGGARVMLREFPTVAQKRNYCGPASLELVLRSLGIDVDQDDIAPLVKRDHGSSILAMTRYLESHGLVTRRFEGDGRTFRACIEHGLPVIVEEEYSTTSHVAVVIGVDDSLGVLFVQDPMTHVGSERLLQTQAGLGAMYRNAAIVALRPEDRAGAAALDAAGVSDAPHVRLVDSCADDEVADDLEEVLRRCDRALALVEDYPLAWYRRTQALFAQALRFRTGNNTARFVTELRKARVRYHGQEWPHVLHGAYLMDDGRHEEALIELEEALRVDPHDSNTAQDIAECHMQQGRRDEATAAFWRTLAIDASHVRANENFSAHALDGGDIELAAHLSACALELAPQNPFNHLIASRVATAQHRDDDALAHARRCVEVQATYVHGHLHLAGLLAGRADDEAQAEASRIYLELTARHPYWFEPRWRAARRLERAGQIGEACELLLAGLEIAQDEPVVLLRTLTEILLEAGDDDRAVELAERFARERPTVGVLEVLWDTLDTAERLERVIDATRVFLASNEKSPFASASYAARLVGLGPERDAEAEQLLRHAITASPTYGWARRMLADLLFVDRPDEAVEVLGAAPPGESYNDVYRASMLADLGRFDEARVALEAAVAAGADGWSAQEVWNRLVLGDDEPAVVLARLAEGDRGDATEPRVLRARLALALASRRWDDAEAMLDRLPDDDVSVDYLIVTAADGNDRFRARLGARFAARIAAPSTAHGHRRYLEAIVAGNRAALGDRSVLEARLASDDNVARVLETLGSLHHDRQRDLVLEIRESCAARPQRALALVEAARAAAMRGDHALAITRSRAAIDRYPRSAGAWATLTMELLMTGDLTGAMTAAERGIRLPSPWTANWEALAAAALVSGRRDDAARWATVARRRALASGFGDDSHTILAATRAALSGDATTIDRLRLARDVHCDPASTLWDRLIDIARAAAS